MIPQGLWCLCTPVVMIGSCYGIMLHNFTVFVSANFHVLAAFLFTSRFLPSSHACMSTRFYFLVPEKSLQ